MEWKYRMLGELVEGPVECREQAHPVAGGSCRICLFRTRAHPWFGELYGKFYERKRVPEDIKDLLTPLVLAVWYMDDGSLSRGAPILNTRAYSREDLFSS